MDLQTRFGAKKTRSVGVGGLERDRDREEAWKKAR